MREKDVNVLKTLYGAIWKTEEFMKEDMSELAIEKLTWGRKSYA